MTEGIGPATGRLPYVLFVAIIGDKWHKNYKP